MKARLALLLLAVGWLCPTSSRAYEVMTYGSVELRWTSLPMKFSIHTAAAPGVSAASTQAAIRAAYQTWSSVSCSAYRSQDVGLVSLAWGDKNDHVNTNSFPPSWPSSHDPNALGITWTQFDPSSGKIVDADTQYNPTDTWAVNGSPLAIDIQSVATHEIGHQLGLDHSSVQQATMFYATGAGDTSQRSLHSDDIAGICYLYPSGKPPPPECSAPEHCSPSETCSGGKCVPAAKKGYGSPCTSPSECQSGACMQSGATSFCSQGCDTSPCPNGDQCVPVQGGGDITKACLAGSGSWGTKQLGEPCQAPTDCKTSLCGSVPGKGYICLQKCDTAKQDCPNGFACASTTSGGYCVPADVPTPPPPVPGSRKIGEACSSSADCESDLCAQDLLSMVCLQPCTPGGPACPAGYRCASTPQGQTGCVRDTPTPPPAGAGALGELCETNEGCASGLCFDDGQGQLYCSELCDPEVGCDGEFDCLAQGEQPLCTARAAAADGDGAKGCSLSPRPSGGGSSAALLVLALVSLLAARRRRGA